MATAAAKKAATKKAAAKRAVRPAEDAAARAPAPAARRGAPAAVARASPTTRAKAAKKDKKSKRRAGKAKAKSGSRKAKAAKEESSSDDDSDDDSVEDGSSSDSDSSSSDGSAATSRAKGATSKKSKPKPSGKKASTSKARSKKKTDSDTDDGSDDDSVSDTDSEKPRAKAAAGKKSKPKTTAKKTGTSRAKAKANADAADDSDGFDDTSSSGSAGASIPDELEEEIRSLGRRARRKHRDRARLRKDVEKWRKKQTNKAKLDSLGMGLQEAYQMALTGFEGSDEDTDDARERTARQRRGRDGGLDALAVTSHWAAAGAVTQAATQVNQLSDHVKALKEYVAVKRATTTQDDDAPETEEEGVVLTAKALEVLGVAYRNKDGEVTELVSTLTRARGRFILSDEAACKKIGAELTSLGVGTRGAVPPYVVTISQAVRDDGKGPGWPQVLCPRTSVHFRSLLKLAGYAHTIYTTECTTADGLEAAAESDVPGAQLASGDAELLKTASDLRGREALKKSMSAEGSHHTARSDPVGMLASSASAAAASAGPAARIKVEVKTESTEDVPPREKAGSASTENNQLTGLLRQILQRNQQSHNGGGNRRKRGGRKGQGGGGNRGGGGNHGGGNHGGGGGGGGQAQGSGGGGGGNRNAGGGQGDGGGKHKKPYGHKRY